MRIRIVRLLAAALMLAATLTVLPASPAAAAGDRCDLRPTVSSSWGCHRVYHTQGYWAGWIDDSLTDGHCVTAYAINSRGQIVRYLGRSCGVPVRIWGSSVGSTAVRVFRAGNYQTVAGA